MIKKMRQALEKQGYTVDEIELLLKSLTELLDKLRREADAVATSTVS
jgi:peptidase E